jgi:hypothetical protein
LNVFDTNNTFPILEIGGASAQIAYVEPSVILPNLTFSVQIGSFSYSVFAHSFLGYGFDQALENISENISVDEHPCLFNGSIYQIGTKLFHGQTSYETCYNLFKGKVYKKSNNCSSYPCFFEDIPLTQNFHEVFASGIVQYLGKYMSYTDEISLEKFQNISYNFSYMTWSEVQILFPNDKFAAIILAEQIVSMNYIGRGLNSNISVILKAPLTINNFQPQWTLGAILVRFSQSVNIILEDELTF